MASYVRDCWYVAGWSKDLVASTPSAVMILGEAIVLWRTAPGRPVALEDRCVHRLAPLSLGRCEGETLRCMYHGLLFDAGGRVVEIPGQTIIPPNAKVRSYPVAEAHDWIWIWMGDPEKADPALIPPAIGPSSPHWLLGTGQLDYDAEASLIHDNLLDFSHLSYVHAKSFEATADWAETPIKFITLDRGVRFERWMPNSELPSYLGSAGTIDGFVTYDFLIPGVLLMWSGTFAPGTAERCGMGRPDFADAIGHVGWTSQAVIPVAHQKARYYFSTGPRADMGTADARDLMLKTTLQAFDEDKRMIEAQQAIINLDPDRRIMPIVHDKATTIFTSLVRRLVDAECRPG